MTAMTGTDVSQMQLPRFSGIPTFMRVPYATDPAAFDIALAGVPFDGGVTARPGARFGPREIRNMSTMMRAIHHVTRFNPFEACRVADVGDVPFDDLYHLERAHDDIRRFFEPLYRAGKIVLAAGGDHSVTYPIFQAIAPQKPIALVHIDAHTDTWDAFKGSKFTHGAPFRRAVEAGLLDPTRTIQIGIRGAQNSDEGWRYSLDHGMRVVFIEEFDALGPAAIAAEARRVVGDGPVYLSLDVDGLDPVFTPGTGTPEIGGLLTRETLALLRGLDGLNWIGGDVVEVSPPYDQTGNTALVAATLMYEMLCLFAKRAAPGAGA
ncbi:agmatinase [Paraburkholderia caballeronis]|uniref:Agmatinase n=2 Tax=Paraburkholderia caballeronis TaxID=416943 RepID=A0A1H7P9F5_9BURK|nr:agmatinase [Paraburkholderia caballeronis]PXX00937.1 agmatinase [Paraburkholderia caballeronis]RAJ99710.1 agmatinase [Paraburkholderia caballeronis]SEE41635.1 agmatinase [Paraburkholderia caballeronis]SEL32279.1 agmatinase [Paraburkholderia caballeronis]